MSGPRRRKGPKESEVKPRALSPKQEKAALLIASGLEKRAAAAEVGVTPQTISEWLKLPGFEACINQERMAALEATRDKMRALGPEAVKAIAEILGDEGKPASRLKAAEVVLKHIGFTDVQSGLWAWGVGGLTESDVERRRERDNRQQSLIDGMFGGTYS
jgi:hypothetical protein